MATTISIQIQQTERLIQDTKAYVEGLKSQRVVATPIALAAETRSKGLSIEVFEQYMSYCNALNEQITQSIIIYIEQLCIPYLEKVLESLKEASQIKI